jgi:predicted oxidoreductase
MVSSQNASNFLNITENSTNDTAKVSKGEELKEISSQLKFLRQHFDISSALHSIRVKNLNDKSFDLNTTRVSGRIADNSVELFSQRIVFLECEHEKLKKQQEDSNQDTLIYRHMLERMRVTRLFLDMKSYTLTKTLRNNSLILNEELEKKRKVRELRIQTKFAVNNLESFINRETKEKLHEVQVIEKDAKQKRDSSKNREIRMRRKLEILEAAADDDRNLKAIQLRESVILHRFWHSLQCKRLTTDSKKFQNLEKAFDEVKKATNTNDTEEVIEKVLTRESNFSEIVESISFSKRKIASYMMKNQEAEEKLKMISIGKNELNPAKAAGVEMARLMKQIEIEKEKYIRLTGTYKNIRQWARRVLESFRFLNEDEGNFYGVELADLIKMISAQVIRSVKKRELKEEKGVKNSCFQSTRAKPRVLESPDDLIKSLNASDSVTVIRRGNYK